MKNLPKFLDKTTILMNEIKKMNFSEQKELWKANDKIVTKNRANFNQMDLKKNLTPAIFAFEGIRYKYMGPLAFTDLELNYLQEHLRIISGFYGVLKPLDGIVPYRLEMKTKLNVGGYNNLYEFWGDLIYKELLDEDRLILNLASKEYSKIVEDYLDDKDKLLDVTFGFLIDGKVKQKATLSKMARGEMVRFLAVNNIKDLDDIKKFNQLGFSYRDDLSSDEEIIFIKE